MLIKGQVFHCEGSLSNNAKVFGAKITQGKTIVYGIVENITGKILYSQPMNNATGFSLRMGGLMHETEVGIMNLITLSGCTKIIPLD